MIEGIPKISIMVITYKQEGIVGRTLDSLVAQKDYLYEICISDDCSPDGTWDVLMSYKKQYPDLIKLHRQEQNVGIFENTEFSWSMPSGDVINEIAGDDTTPDGWYKRVVDFIMKNDIDYKNELFCIYGDFRAVYPNGDSIVFSQKAIDQRPDDALRLAIRGIITGRGCCYSANILRQFEHVSQGRSHIAEMAQDRQLQCFSKKNYYIPYLANVYYSGIGVSVHIEEDTINERQQIFSYAMDYFDKKGIQIRKKEKVFGDFICASLDFIYHHSLRSFCRALICLLQSFDIRYSFRGNGFRHLVFSVLRRLPHRSPIHF